VVSPALWFVTADALIEEGHAMGRVTSLSLTEKLYKDEGYPPMAITRRTLEGLPPHLQPLFRFCKVTSEADTD
jgi:hypothetical protein